MIIVDTNIVFSSLINSNTRIASILLDKKNAFYSPFNLFVELFKHKNKLLKYSRLSEKELLETLSKLLNNIQFVSDKIISNGSLSVAYELCAGVDEEDILFVALAIEYDCLLWTGDKKLIVGLKKKGFDQFFYPE